MTLENFLIIADLIFTVTCGIGYRYCCENVYLHYAKDKKRGRPGTGTSESGIGKFCIAILAQKRRKIND